MLAAGAHVLWHLRRSAQVTAEEIAPGQTRVGMSSRDVRCSWPVWCSEPYWLSVHSSMRPRSRRALRALNLGLASVRRERTDWIEVEGADAPTLVPLAVRDNGPDARPRCINSPPLSSDPENPCQLKHLVHTRRAPVRPDPRAGLGQIRVTMAALCRQQSAALR